MLLSKADKRMRNDAAVFSQQVGVFKHIAVEALKAHMVRKSVASNWVEDEQRYEPLQFGLYLHVLMVNAV